MSLEEIRERRQKQLELARAVEKGQEALGAGDFSQAESYFSAALEMDPNHLIARAGLIQTLRRAGASAEERGKLREARHHYQGVLELDDDHHEVQVRLGAVTRKLTVRFLVIGIIGLVGCGLVLAQLNQFIAWPVEVCDATGDVLCTPSPTATYTPTATATATPTATPTSTATPTPTPTNTPTATPTPTPTPMFAEGASSYPNVFDEPGGTLIGTLTLGQRVYVCARHYSEADDRMYYQIALDHCHSVAPYGWVPSTQLDLKFFEGDFPTYLMTPPPEE